MEVIVLNMALNRALGLQESVDDETTGGAFPLRVAVKGVTVDISALSLTWDMVEQDNSWLVNLPPPNVPPQK